MSSKVKNLDRDKIDFANGKIGALFRAMFFPTLIGMLFNSALTIIDGVFVGQGVGADGIASVNIVAPGFMLGIGIGLMLGIGASVIASIRLSEGNVKAARIIMTQAFIAGFIIMGIMTAVCMMAPTAVVRLLGASPRLEAPAATYLIWAAPSFLFMMVQSVGMMLARLDGSPKYAMTVQVVAAVINGVLDWYTIFILGWGLMGAAFSTSIAYCIGAIMILVYFLKFSDKLKFYRLKCTLTSLILSVRNVGYIIRLGFATFLTELAMGVMMLTGNYMFISMLGEAGVAAFSIACYLFPLVFSASNAVAQSAQPIISYNYGAGAIDRVRRTLGISLFTAIVCGIIITVALWLGAQGIVRMFLSPDELAFSEAVEGLPLFATCAIFFAVNIAFIGYYQSIEKAGISTLYTLLRGIVFLVPCFILLPRVLGVNGLWLSIPTAEILTLIVILTGYGYSRYKKSQK